MSSVAEETSYYLSSSTFTLALIAKGVRVPAGTWMRVVSGAVPKEHVEQMLANVFPNLRGKVLTFVSLSTEDEVKAFEASNP